MYEGWMKTKDSHKLTGLLCYDFSSAFDTLDGHILSEKLALYGVCESAINLIRSFLSGRNQFVEFNGLRSQLTSVGTGTPQGSCLSPIWFIIYIADINLWTTESSLTKYADDTYQWCQGNSVKEITESLERDSIQIIKFASSNKLILNQNKTKFVLFHPRKSDVANRSITVGKELIHESTEIKILGLTLNNDLNWNSHIAKLTNTLHSRLFLLRKLANHLPRRCLSIILDGFFMSQIRYGLSVYGRPEMSTNPSVTGGQPAYMKQLQVLQNAAMRVTTGTKLSDKVRISNLLAKTGQMNINQVCITSIASTVKSILSHNTIPEIKLELTRNHNKSDLKLVTRSQARQDLSASQPKLNCCRGFSFWAAQVWNSIPTSIRNSCSSDSTFKKDLKTFVKQTFT